MRAGRLPWTDAETEILTSMRQDGKSNGEIAQRLRRSKAAVQSKTSNLSLYIAPVPAPAPTARICATRAQFVTATLMGDPPSGRSALDQRTRP